MHVIEPNNKEKITISSAKVDSFITTGEWTDDTTSGFVKTQQGYVRVYAQEGGEFKPKYSFVEMVYRKKTYKRIYNKRYSDRYLVTLAKRFAKDVANKVYDLSNPYNSKL